MNYHDDYQKKGIDGKSILSIIAIIAIALFVGTLSSLYSYSFFYFFASLFIFGVVVFQLSYKTEKTTIFLAFLLLIALFLIPGVSLGGIGFRLDDGIVVLLGLVILHAIYKGSGNLSTPINKFIIIYVTYMLLITFVNILFNDLPLFLGLFAIKEFQYFIYFFAFVYIMKSTWCRENFTKTFLWSALISMIWGAYQLLFDAGVGFYGIGLMSETSSSQSGGAFYLISMFFLYLINYEHRFWHRVLYFILFCWSAGMVFATVSRTAILALGISYVVYLGFTVFRMSAKRIIISVYVLALASPALYFILKDYLEKIFHRLQNIDSGASYRANKWENLLSYSSDLGKVFGEGRGFAQTITGSLTLAIDSQYVRNILELGYVGSILFILIMLSIFIFAFRNIKKYYGESLFLILITCGFLVMSVTHEVFLVTIQASIYWILVGAFVGKIVHDKKHKMNKVTKQLEETVQ